MDEEIDDKIFAIDNQKIMRQPTKTSTFSEALLYTKSIMKPYCTMYASAGTQLMTIPPNLQKVSQVTLSVSTENSKTVARTTQFETRGLTLKKGEE